MHGFSKDSKIAGLPKCTGLTDDTYPAEIMISKGTLAVTIVALVQLIAVLLLYNKVGVLERDIAAAISVGQIPAYQGAPAKVADPVQLTRADTSPGEDRMRQIIQEVLRAELKDLRSTDQTNGTAVAVNPIDETEAELQRDLVLQQIEYYSSFGRISDVEMQQLQTEISKLDDAHRTEALRQLTRALNSGNLKGRL